MIHSFTFKIEVILERCCRKGVHSSFEFLLLLIGHRVFILCGRSLKRFLSIFKNEIYSLKGFIENQKRFFCSRGLQSQTYFFVIQVGSCDTRWPISNISNSVTSKSALLRTINPLFCRISPKSPSFLRVSECITKQLVGFRILTGASSVSTCRPCSGV